MQSPFSRLEPLMYKKCLINVIYHYYYIIPYCNFIVMFISQINARTYALMHTHTHKYSLNAITMTTLFITHF